MSGRNRGLFGALRRMVSSNAESESEDLRREAELQAVDTIDHCGHQQRVVLRGTIRTLTLSLESENPRLEAEFDDGSGTIVLVWMGRRQIPGIQAGTVLRIEGRLSQHRGRLAMYNPRYELMLVPGPD